MRTLTILMAGALALGFTGCQAPRSEAEARFQDALAKVGASVLTAAEAALIARINHKIQGGGK